MQVNVGSVWKKVGMWGGKEGQLVIVENVSEVYVNYRYSDWNSLNHDKGIWIINKFLKRFRLIKDVE